MTKPGSNTFGHDYIIRALDAFMTDLKTAKPVPQIIDKTACILTAFMMGEVAAQLKARPQQTIAPSATIEDVLKQLITEAGIDEVEGVLHLLKK